MSIVPRSSALWSLLSILAELRVQHSSASWPTASRASHKARIITATLTDVPRASEGQEFESRRYVVGHDDGSDGGRPQC